MQDLDEIRWHTALNRAPFCILQAIADAPRQAWFVRIRDQQVVLA